MEPETPETQRDTHAHRTQQEVGASVQAGQKADPYWWNRVIIPGGMWPLHSVTPSLSTSSLHLHLHLHLASESSEISTFLPSAASTVACPPSPSSIWTPLLSAPSSLKASFVRLETVKLCNYLYKRCESRRPLAPKGQRTHKQQPVTQ